MPQHFHMSTGFLFVITLFVIALIVVILCFIISMRRDKQAAAFELARIENNKAYYADLNKRYPNHRHGFVEGSPISPTPEYNRHGPGYIPPATAYQSPAPPVAAYAPTTVMHNGGGSDMLTGMLVGNMLAGGGHGHGGGDTYINNAPAPAYEAPDSGGMSWGSDSSGGGDSGGCGGGD